MIEVNIMSNGITNNPPPIATLRRTRHLHSILVNKSIRNPSTRQQSDNPKSGNILLQNVTVTKDKERLENLFELKGTKEAQ